GDLRFLARAVNGAPKPGSASENLVEPARAVILDAPRQHLVFPVARGCGEALQPLQDQLDVRRTLAAGGGMDILPAQQEIRENLRQDCEPLAPPDGNRHAADLGEILSIGPTRLTWGACLLDPNDLADLGPAFEEL